MKRELYTTDIPSILASELFPRGMAGGMVSRTWRMGGDVPDCR